MESDERRRVPGGVVPRQRPEAATRRDAREEGAAPFDPAERPLGMIHETWAPKEKPGLLKEEVPNFEADASRERIGPALTVWVILIALIVVVILAVISYRNAPP